MISPDFTDVKGYEGLYAISKNGQVWSYPKYSSNREKGGRLLKPYKIKSGYLTLMLTKDGIGRTRYVHRLVAETYLPNPNELPYVNHLDGDKLNNDIKNLEWCTPTENSRHSWTTGLQKLNHNDNCTCFRCKPHFLKGVKYARKVS